MFIRGCFFLLGAFLFCFAARADDMTLYDIINNEDQDAFSDMVIIGYDIDQRDKDRNTPLMIASSLGKLSFVRFLLINDAQINLRNRMGMTALHLAAQNGHDKVVLALLEAGARLEIPDTKGSTALMTAAEAGKVDMVELLHQKGASLNYRNAAGDTALRIADRKRFSKVSAYLRKNRATY